MLILQMKNISWAIVVMEKCRSKSRLHWEKSPSRHGVM